MPGPEGVASWGAREGADTGEGHAGRGPTGSTPMFTREGRRVPVPNNQVDSEFKSGRLSFQRGIQVPVLTEEGVLQQLPSDEVADYLLEHNGRRIALGSEYEQAVQVREGQRAQEHYDSARGAITSAVQNIVAEINPTIERDAAINTAQENERRQRVAAETGGVYVPIENPLEAGRENNPVSAFLGRAAPWVGLAVATDGIGLTGGGLATGGLAAGVESTAARTVGRYAAERSARAMLSAGMEAERAAQLSGLIGRAAVTTTENAAFGALASARETVAANRPFAAEAFIADVGISSLLGLGVEGGIGAIVAGARGARTMAAKRAEDAVDLNAFIAEQRNTPGPIPSEPLTPGQRFAAGVTTVASGGSVEENARAMGQTIRNLRQAAEADRTLRPATILETADDALSLRNAVDDAFESQALPITQMAQGDVRVAAEQVVSRLRGIYDALPEGVTKAGIGGDKLKSHIANIIDEIQANHVGTPSTASRFDDEGILRLGDAGAPAVTDMPTLMFDLHNAKRAIREFVETATENGTATGTIRNTTGQLQRSISGILSDSSLFGDAATAYARWAEASHVGLTGLEEFTSKFTKRRTAGLVGPDGKTLPPYETNVDAIKQAAGNEIDPLSMTARREMDGYIGEMRQGLEMLRDAGRLSDDIYQPILGTMDRVRNGRDFAMRLGDATKFLKDIVRREGSSVALAGLMGLTPMTGAILGSMAGGFGGTLVGGLAGLAVTSAMRLGRTISVLDTLERNTRGFFTRLDKGFRGIESAVAGRSRRMPRAGAFVPMMWDQDASEEKKNTVYLAAVDNIRRLATDPQQMVDSLMHTVPTGEQLLPLSNQVVASAQRSVSYLNNLIPPVVEGPLVGRKERLPSLTQRDAFLRAMAGIDDPLLLVEGLVNGNVPTETVAAIKAVYPEFYKYSQQRIIQILSETPNRSNYNFRIQLSRVMDLPTDTTLQPNMMAVLQQRFAQTTSQAQSQGMHRAPARALTTSTNTYSEYQRIQGK